MFTILSVGLCELRLYLFYYGLTHRYHDNFQQPSVACCILTLIDQGIKYLVDTLILFT